MLTSLSGLLEDAGSSLELAVKTTCFLQDLGDFPAFNEVYAGFFSGDNAPARSTVQVAKLPMGVLVEIECVALVREAINGHSLRSGCPARRPCILSPHRATRIRAFSSAGQSARFTSVRSQVQVL